MSENRPEDLSEDKSRFEAEMDRLLWLDMEMTGLSPEKNVIIEAAAVVTDADLNEKETYESVVKQPQKYLDEMDKWNQKCHRKSGLYPLIPKGRSLFSVETDLLHLAEQHFSESKKVILAGNCVFQDRNFIRRYMPRLEQRLFYRMLDVSSWKWLFQKKGFLFEKQNAHRALADAKESIQEFRFYLNHITFLSSPSLASAPASGVSAPPSSEQQKPPGAASP